MAAADRAGRVAYTPLTAWFGALPSTYDEMGWDPDACGEYVDRLIVDEFSDEALKPEARATLAEMARHLWPFASDEADLRKVLVLLCCMLLADVEDEISAVTTTIGSCLIDARITPCDDDSIVAVHIHHEPTRRDLIQEEGAGATPTHERCMESRDLYRMVFDLSTMHSTSLIGDFIPADPTDERNRPVQRLFSEEAETTIEITGYDPNTHLLATGHGRVHGRWPTAAAYGLSDDDAIMLCGIYGVVMADDGSIAKILHPEPTIMPLTEWLIARSDEPDLCDRYRRCAPAQPSADAVGAIRFKGIRYPTVYTSERGRLSMTLTLDDDVIVHERGVEIRMDLPDTVLSSAIGRPMIEFVNHPMLEGLRITGSDDGELLDVLFHVSPEKSS